jgi:hypothetical protein
MFEFALIACFGLNNLWFERSVLTKKNTVSPVFGLFDGE